MPDQPMEFLENPVAYLRQIVEPYVIKYSKTVVRSRNAENIIDDLSSLIERLKIQEHRIDGLPLIATTALEDITDMYNLVICFPKKISAKEHFKLYDNIREGDYMTGIKDSISINVKEYNFMIFVDTLPKLAEGINFTFEFRRDIKTPQIKKARFLLDAVNVLYNVLSNPTLEKAYLPSKS